MAIPFNGHMVTRLRAWFHRHLRAVVNMPAHLTKIGNKELRTQFDLPDPIQMIEQQIVQKIKHLQANHGDAAIRGRGVLEHWQTLQTTITASCTQPHKCSYRGNNDNRTTCMSDMWLVLSHKKGTASTPGTSTWADTAGQSPHRLQTGTTLHRWHAAMPSLSDETLQLAGTQRSRHAECL